MTMGSSFLLTLIYTCDRNQRLDLQDNIFSIPNESSGPWFIGRDFNAILNASDTIRGLPITTAEIEDFKHYVESRDLIQVQHKGSYLLGGMGELGMTVIF